MYGIVAQHRLFEYDNCPHKRPFKQEWHRIRAERRLPNSTNAQQQLPTHSRKKHPLHLFRQWCAEKILI